MALLFKGRILYEDKKDYAAAIASWEQFLRMMPQGGPADVVRGWIEEARREARKMEGDGQPTKDTLRASGWTESISWGTCARSRREEDRRDG